MKLKDISRTATFAWDPSTAADPLIVTGAVAGALDDSFSNDSQLEIWAPKFFQSEGKGDPQTYSLGGQGSGPDGSVSVNSRFNRLAWSQPGATPSGRGIIAAGMETGELYMYDPVKILAKENAQIYKNDKHSGPIRGLDWNPIQKNLVLSGATNAELYIHDLNNLGEPIPPGPVSTKLNEITSLQWNPSRARVFAASSSSGYSSIWDLGSGKEVAALQYGGGAAKGDSTHGGAGTQIGKRRGMSDLCWHPTQATRLVTASEDDESPIVMMWDLRNTRAPERILTGHTKGVLSVSWCKQDADLLASCGKDNRTLIWNPQTGDIVGELPQTGDWAFETAWCPSNPNMLAVASFDGHIALNSLQSTRPKEAEENKFAADATEDDIFGALAQADASEDVTNVKSLTQAPKWMLRPCSASWGYGGLLATVSNLPAASGKHQSSVVHLRYVVTEDSIIERAKALEDISSNKEKLAEFASSKSQDSSWKALQSLFRANSRDELIALLGFSKEEVARQVQDVVKKLAPPTVEETPAADDEGEITPKTDKDDKELKADKTPETKSEASALFTEDGPVTPAEAGGETDFFASMATGGSAPLRNPQLDSIVPHVGQAPDSSVAATAGSGASSVRSESIKDNHFNIYPSGESETDRLITQALVLGDFKSAVDLCLAAERYADALLLAIRGGPELLQATQKAYFKRRTMAHPFLRVFQSIVTEDLADIVQNADLSEWKVVFAVVCTFAKDADFGNLADQLGRRLQFKWQLLSASDSPEAAANAKVARQDATLCYLAARNLERVVSIWTNEMQEEEAATDAPRYSAHANALQSFIEKVTAFQAATGYVDKDLTAQTPEGSTRPYPLAGLYDRFYEYADLLATQGLVDAAAKYVKMTPKDYKGADNYQLDKARSRLLTAAGVPEASSSASSSSAFGARAKPSATAGRYAPMPGFTGSPYNTGSAYGSAAPAYGGQGASAYQQTYGQTASPYQPSAPAYPQTSGPYDPAGRRTPTSGYGQTGVSNPYAPAPSANRVASPPTNYGAGFQPATAYGQNGYQPQQQYGGSGYGSQPTPAAVPPPPRVSESNNPPIIPASQRRDMPGWNDAPSVLVTSKKQGGGSASSTPKPAPITSPFPMSEQSGPAPPHLSGATSPPAGPPRSGPPGVVPPPPKGGPPRPPSVARNAPPSGGPRPPSAGASPYGQPPQQSPFGQAPQQHSPYGAPPQQQSPYGQPSNPYGQPQMPPQQHQHQHQQQQQHAPQFVPPPPKGGPPPPRGASPRAGPPPPGVVAGPPPARALSPLGPGNRAAHQSMPQSMPHGGPPPGGPPPMGGPPPPGARMGGPPPPGRAGPPPPGRQ